MRNACHTIARLAALACSLVLASAAHAQSAAGAGTHRETEQATTAATLTAGAAHAQPAATYVRPTERQKLTNFAFDALGPYPFVGALGAAGIQQAYGTPREWGQGADSFGVRVASDFGIALTTTTTRYTLAEAFREDTLYYRCGCKGALPRLSHALISTVTARRDHDGHRVFSFPGLAAPYAGTMTAALGWYPDRYGPKDGFRMGNYNLLSQAAQNVALEFVYGGPHTLLGSMHIPGLSGKGKEGDTGSAP
jgi:hypothetical protein